MARQGRKRRKHQRSGAQKLRDNQQFADMVKSPEGHWASLKNIQESLKKH